MESAAVVLGRTWHPAISSHEPEERMHTVSGKVLSESLADPEEKGPVDRE